MDSVSKLFIVTILVTYIFSLTSSVHAEAVACILGDDTCRTNRRETNHFLQTLRIYDKAVVGTFEILDEQDDFLVTKDSWEGIIAVRVNFIPTKNLVGNRTDLNEPVSMYLLGSVYAPATIFGEKFGGQEDSYVHWKNLLEESFDTLDPSPWKVYEAIESTIVEELQLNLRSSVSVVTARVKLGGSHEFPPIRNALVPIFEGYPYVFFYNGEISEIEKNYSPSKFNIYPLVIYDKFIKTFQEKDR